MLNGFFDSLYIWNLGLQDDFFKRDIYFRIKFYIGSMSKNVIMSRSELQEASCAQLNEQVYIRERELQADTGAMEETQRSVTWHQAEVNNIQAKIQQLQQLNALMQQQQQHGGGGPGQ